MITNKRNLTDVFDKSVLLQEGYTDAWVQSLNQVAIGSLSEVELDQDTVLEARIVGHGKEIHVFGYQEDGIEEKLRAVETILEEQDQYIDSQKQTLRKKYGDYVIMRQILGKDEDGQAYAVRTVLAEYGKGGHQR
jgi:hypothetical protein